MCIVICVTHDIPKRSAINFKPKRESVSHQRVYPNRERMIWKRWPNHLVGIRVHAFKTMIRFFFVRNCFMGSRESWSDILICRFLLPSFKFNVECITNDNNIFKSLYFASVFFFFLSITFDWSRLCQKFINYIHFVINTLFLTICT